MSLRRLALKIGVTIAGPLVILAGVAMLVLPGPGLVVIAAGFGLLAAEYPWARRLVVAGGHVLRRLKELAFPQGGSPTRKRHRPARHGWRSSPRRGRHRRLRTGAGHHVRSGRRR